MSFDGLLPPTSTAVAELGVRTRGQVKYATANMATEVMPDVYLPSSAPAAFPGPIPTIEGVSPQQVMLIRDAVLRVVLLQLPTLFAEFQMQNGRYDETHNETFLSTPGVAVETLEKEMTEVKKKNVDYDNKIKGYDTKMKTWTDSVKNLNSNVSSLASNIEELRKDVSNVNQIVTKTKKDFSDAQAKIENSIKESEKCQASLKKSIETIQTVDGKKIIEIEGSQEFVSSKYDEVVKRNLEMKDEIFNLAAKVEKNSSKTEHNAGYSRLDNAEFAGIPVQHDFEGKENCKKNHNGRL